MYIYQNPLREKGVSTSCTSQEYKMTKMFQKPRMFYPLLQSAWALPRFPVEFCGHIPWVLQSSWPGFSPKFRGWFCKVPQIFGGWIFVVFFNFMWSNVHPFSNFGWILGSLTFIIPMIFPVLVVACPYYCPFLINLSNAHEFLHFWTLFSQFWMCCTATGLDGRIDLVCASARRPPGAQVIDGSRKLLLPGCGWEMNWWLNGDWMGGILVI